VYSRANLRENQVDLEMEVKMRLRRKKDRYETTLVAETSNEFDDEFDDAFGEEIPQTTGTSAIMWTNLMKRLRWKNTDRKSNYKALALEMSNEFDDELDDEFGEEITQMTITKSVMWMIGAVAIALATIGMNIYSVILTTGIVGMISCWIVSLVSVTVAVRELFMDDVNSEYLCMRSGEK
jgi:hypothetical protein